MVHGIRPPNHAKIHTMSQKPILLIIKGYAGAGKSTLAFEYAKQYDFALIKQDTFIFELNPGSMLERIARAPDTASGFKNILSVIENYMVTQKPIILEGTLVALEKHDPLDFEPILELAKKYEYQTVLITITAKERTRRWRQLKRRYRLPIDLDRKLADLADEHHLPLPNHIIDTTKMSKSETLVALHNVISSIPPRP